MTQEKVRVPDLARMKAARQPITMLTAYDFPFARIFDNCGVDVLLARLRVRAVVRWSSPTCRSCRTR
jgi:3-methyl-2-oxobutanoate hydroxymethyltransferase